MSVSPLAEKFNIVNNDHGRTTSENVPFSTGNALFGQIGQIWYLDLFEYVEFNGDVHFFCFSLEIPLLGKLGPKSQNCQFNLKLVPGLIPICRVQWRCSLFFVLDWKHHFAQICSKKIKVVS